MDQNNKIPTIEQAGMSRRAKNICLKMGFERTDPITELPQNIYDYLNVQNCGMKTAKEILGELRRYKNGAVDG